MSTQSTAVAAVGAPNIPALQMDESELVKVLETSIYPGAKLESIKFAIGYCKATNKDPMKRPVHIVPMSVKLAATNEYVWRDVIMPGINDYRVDAARTGVHAGNDDAKFGPPVEKKFGEVSVTYPEWCEFTVYRMVNGQRCAFTSGQVRWTETYATVKRDSDVPNAMWKKRPYGQLEKCAEALALRRAFPEVGNQPTAEEMEGRVIDNTEGLVIEGEHSTSLVAQPQSKAEVQASAQQSSSPQPSQETATGSDKPSASAAQTITPLSEGALKTLNAALTRAALTEADLVAAQHPKIADMTFESFNDVMDWIKKNAKH
jgi:phage recombination protein Bet